MQIKNRNLVIPISILLLIVTAIAGSIVFGKSRGEFISPLSSNNTFKNQGDLPQFITKKKVYGFLPYWSLENSEHLKFNYLSTIIYHGLEVDDDGTFVKIKDDGTSELGWLNWKKSETLERVISEAKGTETRFALSIYQQNNKAIENFLSCRSCWDVLIQNTLEEMEDRNIKDVNLDFEYSGIAPTKTRDSYSQFVEIAVEEIHREIPGSEVLVDTFANAAKRTRLHDISKLSQSADKLIVMAYDFHQLTDDRTGPVAPLNGAPDKYRYDLNEMLEDYKRFSKPQKLVLGVAYYGYIWITESEALGSLRIPGNETIGYSKTAYYETCEYHDENKKGQKRWDEDSQTPWFHFFDEEKGVYKQCHYENKESLAAKYDFVMENNLAGIGIWALGYDGEHPELWDLLREKF